ncbi:4-hydroxyphenylacetate 3-monooxygenase, oxygenase component [Halalkalibacterium ligniniphilum]|uniref:4-hydroxyphenylacetate 3-monooxygenase, oxygenase component n=1 Tax=Halalkalibacterium ligniniphilum TaxID=1134413 RepID=UPI00034D2E7A
MITGQEYVDRIDGLQNKIWIEGEQVTGKLSEHPAFRGILKRKAALYDLQHNTSYQDLLTRQSSETNERIGFSFEQPTSKKMLKKRRLATQCLARMSAGTMGRSPDYLNTAIMTLGTSHTFFEEPFQWNILSIYEQAKKQDLSFTHTFINPQVNRSTHYVEYSDDNIIAAKVIDETDKGIVIHGARLLATQGGLTDQILVFPAGGNFVEPAFIYGFAIPSNTPGLKFICRESYAKHASNTFDHPLSTHFDEMDSIVVFDHVLVPWDRVFLYQNSRLAGQMYQETQLNIMLLFQAISRQAVKAEYLLGIGDLLAQTIQITDYQHIQEKISELIMTHEIMKSLLISAETNATKNKFGTMVPDPKPLSVACSYFQKTYARLVEILHLLGASGYISLPTEKDFDSAIGKDLDQYLQAAGANARDRVQLYRFAWDLTMSAFGSRQTQYERFFFGDPVRLSCSLYHAYDRKACIEQVKAFLKDDK